MGCLNEEISLLRELEKVAQIVHMSGQWDGRSNDGHARKRIFFGRTSLFHDYDLILCPHPVSQVLQLEDTVERQQRFISRLEEERDRCARRKWQT